MVSETEATGESHWYTVRDDAGQLVGISYAAIGK
jgi:YD repeat-containing protein